MNQNRQKKQEWQLHRRYPNPRDLRNKPMVNVDKRDSGQSHPERNAQEQMRRKKNNPQQNSPDVFSDGFVNQIGNISKIISEISSMSLIFGMVLAAAFLDVILGAFGLENIFNYNIPYGQYMIKTVWIAAAISVFTSGVQVYLRLMWSSERRNRKMNRREKAIMYFIMLLDTAIDMTVPGYLMYGETALTMTLIGKPAMYYVVTILIGSACAFSENVIVALGSFSAKGGLFDRQRTKK